MQICNREELSSRTKICSLEYVHFRHGGSRHQTSTDNWSRKIMRYNIFGDKMAKYVTNITHLSPTFYVTYRNKPSSFVSPSSEETSDRFPENMSCRIIFNLQRLCSMISKFLKISLFPNARPFAFFLIA